jgi:hypothetical protein
MESNTTRKRVREKFAFGKDIYMKLYMSDSVIQYVLELVLQKVNHSKSHLFENFIVRDFLFSIFFFDVFTAIQLRNNMWNSKDNKHNTSFIHLLLLLELLHLCFDFSSIDNYFLIGFRLDI